MFEPAREREKLAGETVKKTDELVSHQLLYGLCLALIILAKLKFSFSVCVFVVTTINQSIKILFLLPFLISFVFSPLEFFLSLSLSLSTTEHNIRSHHQNENPSTCPQLQ